MSARRLGFFVVLGLAASACSSSDAAPATGGSTISAADLDFSKYDAAVSAFLKDHGLTGASGVVVHKDLGIVHTTGYGDFTADRLYLVARRARW
jgi:hypothetical protein